MLAAALALVALGSLKLDLFSVVSLVGFLVVVELTAPFNVTPPWRRRLKWLILAGLLVFGYVVVRRILAILPPGVVGRLLWAGVVASAATAPWATTSATPGSSWRHSASSWSSASVVVSEGVDWLIGGGLSSQTGTGRQLNVLLRPSERLSTDRG